MIWTPHLLAELRRLIIKAHETNETIIHFYGQDIGVDWAERELKRQERKDLMKRERLYYVTTNEPNDFGRTLRDF